MQDHNHALANLATVTQSDCDTVAYMSKTIADLDLQLRKANTKLAEAQSSIATLTSKLSKTGEKPKRFSTSPTTAMSSSQYNNRFLKDGYCWSHGFKVTHNITNSENKKSDHMIAAATQWAEKCGTKFGTREGTSDNAFVIS